MEILKNNQIRIEPTTVALHLHPCGSTSRRPLNIIVLFISLQIYFHPPNSETLYQYISKEDLPADYGGSRPPMSELNKDIDALISRNR